jgi:hypothetical protein
MPVTTFSLKVLAPHQIDPMNEFAQGKVPMLLVLQQVGMPTKI